MKDNVKQLPWIVLAIGFIVYTFCVINNMNVELYCGLTLMVALSSWACIKIALESFKITDFIKLFAVAGYIFAITVFFFSGVEEVSFPEGAIVFHISQIVKSIGIAFIASLPLLYFYDNRGITESTVSKKTSDDSSNDNWEAATQEDLDSGQWELEG